MAKSTKDVAREKGVSRRTAQRWAKNKKIKAAKKTGHDWTVSSASGAKKNKKRPKNRKK